MPIIYHEKSKTFHLFNEDVSYVMKVSAGGAISSSFIMGGACTTGRALTTF